VPNAASVPAEMVIAGAGRSWNVSLNPRGVVIGRVESCGIVLDDRQVSRHHARLYQDPFGRWIIEDLASRNGTVVGGQRIKRQAVAPGQRIVIGPFTLKLSVPLNWKIPSDESIGTATVLVETPAEESVVHTPPEAKEALSGTYLKELEAIGDRLARVPSSRDVYPEACKYLADHPATAALVLRLVRGAEALPKSPEILACQFGGTTVIEPGVSPHDYRLSRRVIKAATESGQSVMASNVRLGGEQLGLTIVGDLRPRAVYCAPITLASDWADVLYLEMSADQADAEMLDFVRAVARQIGLVTQSVLHVEDAAKIRQIDQQLAMARDIQASLIPKSLDLSPHVDLALSYEPALWVGGDYCDVWPLADGRIAFAVGDVAGKGLPAAMVMANLQAVLRSAVAFRPNPAEAMTHVNKHLERHMPSDMFVTMVMGILEPDTGKLEYVNAGHLLPLLVSPSGVVSALGKPSNPPLGFTTACLSSDTAVLELGTGLVAMTDGVTEAMSPEGELLGSERLVELLGQVKFASSEDLVRVVTQAANAFRGPLPPHDDMTVLAILKR
jgi:sigma-B regulation protein RsbU (phosphoserine phosphatase)